MMRKNSLSNSLGVVLQLVGARWKLLVVQELLKQEMRFTELKNKLRCTSKVLSSCLKEMEEDGLVIREESETAHNVVEYYLTDLGYTLRPIVESMQKWGNDYKRYKKLMSYKEANK